jgi:tRNA G46 methylase TrmB
MQTHSLTINYNSSILMTIQYRHHMLILHSPVCPAAMDWSPYYPAFVVPQEPGSDELSTNALSQEKIIPQLVKDVEIADIGCGFGGLLVALAPMLPDKLLLGKIF